MFADVQDVRDRTQELQVNDTYLSAIVEDANTLLNARVPDLIVRSNNEPELAKLAKMIVCNAVIRYVTNPVQAIQETFGSYSVTHNRNDGVWFRDDEIELLIDNTIVATDIVRSVRVTSPFMR